MSLGTVKTVRRGSIPPGAKKALTRFAKWVLMRSDGDTFKGTDVEVVIYFGAGLRHVYKGEAYGEEPYVHVVPLHGMTRAVMEQNIARMKAGKPMRISLHLTPQVLCNPVELAKTIVHEQQHITDIIVNTITTAGGILRSPSLEWMENRAELAEVEFMHLTPRQEIIHAYYGTVAGPGAEFAKVQALCARYGAETL